MFKKLKERIESVDENKIPKRPPGLAVRSPPADTNDRSIAQELVMKKSEPTQCTSPTLSTEIETEVEEKDKEPNQSMEDGETSETEEEGVDDANETSNETNHNVTMCVCVRVVSI